MNAPLTSPGQRGRIRKLSLDESGASLVSYAVVTGAIAIVSVVAVVYLNHLSEQKIQERADQTGKRALSSGSDPSLEGEVAESSAVYMGADLPFQFGLPLFSPAGKRKQKRDAAPDANGAGTSRDLDGALACSGPSCGERGSCFVAGTLVLTPSGYKKIEDIQVGDEVLSIAEESAWTMTPLPTESASAASVSSGNDSAL